MDNQTSILISTYPKVEHRIKIVTFQPKTVKIHRITRIKGIILYGNLQIWIRDQDLQTPMGAYCKRMAPKL